MEIKMIRFISFKFKTNTYLQHDNPMQFRDIKFIYTRMNGKGNFKFKVINGILSWKNDEMERFIPVSAEILTRVILLYEKQLKNGIRIWKQIEQQENQELDAYLEDPYFQQLADWMDQLQGIFENTEPSREKEMWMGTQINLN
ncbi:MAG TPA: hypothetical protein VFE04_06040 [Puia sp.]|nr:hypothetical protein [Puia sp.]